MIFLNPDSLRTPLPISRRAAHGLRCSNRAALSVLSALLITALGCSTASLRSISVSPSPGTETLTGAGQTFQYKAIGTYQQGTHPSSTQDVTDSVAWSSGNTSVATVSSTGVVTSVGAGMATITATSGNISSASDVTVVSGVAATHSLTSITLIPNAIPVLGLGETEQFIAVGNYNGSPAAQDLTNLVTWASSDVTVARIDAAGLATTTSSGSTTISALYTPAASAANPAPATIVATTSLVASTTSPVTLPTLTIFKVGTNAAAGTVTGSYTLPGTTSPITLTCGPGATAATCTENVPVGTVVTLTTPNTGATPQFGGWSSNCTRGASAYTCTVPVPVPGALPGSLGNVTVGAIFD